MTRIFIPGNTNNCISKISEHEVNLRKSTLFLGSLQATEKEILREYRISAILTVGS